MYRNKRHTFKTLVFCSPFITSVEDVTMFIHGHLKYEETIVENENLSVKHAYYLSSSEFTVPEALQNIIESNENGVITYRYNIYFSIVRLSDKLMVMISVPFSKMASEIFTAFSVFARGKSVKYQKVDLPKFIELSNKDSMAGDVKITSINIEVEGDSPTKAIILKGTNVPISSTYRGVIDSLVDVKHKIKGCSIVYNNRNGIKQLFKIDRFGMYLLPIAAEAKNLPSILNLFGFFSSEELLVEDPLLPASIKKEDEEEDD